MEPNKKMIVKRLAREMGKKSDAIEVSFDRGFAMGLASCLYYMDVFDAKKFGMICDKIRAKGRAQ